MKKGEQANKLVEAVRQTLRTLPNAAKSIAHKSKVDIEVVLTARDKKRKEVLYGRTPAEKSAYIAQYGFEKFTEQYSK